MLEKGAANLKVHLIVQNFCMYFIFEFWRKNSKLRCMQNFKNKLYLETTIPFAKFWHVFCWTMDIHTCYLFFCHSVEKHWLDSSNVLPAERTLSVPLMDLTRALAALTGMAAR